MSGQNSTRARAAAPRRRPSRGGVDGAGCDRRGTTTTAPEPPERLRPRRAASGTPRGLTRRLTRLVSGLRRRARARGHRLGASLLRGRDRGGARAPGGRRRAPGADRAAGAKARRLDRGGDRARRALPGGDRAARGRGGACRRAASGSMRRARSARRLPAKLTQLAKEGGPEARESGRRGARGPFDGRRSPGGLVCPGHRGRRLRRERRRVGRAAGSRRTRGCPSRRCATRLRAESSRA